MAGEVVHKRKSTVYAIASSNQNVLPFPDADITPQEATLYLLGIYEDTGLLTFASTTAEDARMVAALIERGGDTSIINDHVKREFSREQVFVLNELLINLSLIVVNGITVAYSYASINEYVEELAHLTHRIMDMEGLAVLFIMVRSGPRIVLIGRSKDHGVDVSKVPVGTGSHACRCGEFGQSSGISSAQALRTPVRASGASAPR